MGRLEVNSAVGLNVRSGPGLTYPVLDTLNNGDVIDEVLIDGWVMLVMDDESFGFVSRKLLIPAPPINTPEPSVPSTSDVRLQAASFLVLRTEPKTCFEASKSLTEIGLCKHLQPLHSSTKYLPNSKSANQKKIAPCLEVVTLSCGEELLLQVRRLLPLQCRRRPQGRPEAG